MTSSSVKFVVEHKPTLNSKNIYEAIGQVAVARSLYQRKTGINPKKVITTRVAVGENLLACLRAERISLIRVLRGQGCYQRVLALNSKLKQIFPQVSD